MHLYLHNQARCLAALVFHHMDVQPLVVDCVCVRVCVCVCVEDFTHKIKKKNHCTHENYHEAREGGSPASPKISFMRSDAPLITWCTSTFNQVISKQEAMGSNI
jgi:hypothetical protein